MSDEICACGMRGSGHEAATAPGCGLWIVALSNTRLSCLHRLQNARSGSRQRAAWRPGSSQVSSSHVHVCPRSAVQDPARINAPQTVKRIRVLGGWLSGMHARRQMQRECVPAEMRAVPSRISTRRRAWTRRNKGTAAGRPSQEAPSAVNSPRCRGGRKHAAYNVLYKVKGRL